jgi:uncharacterized protein
MCPRRKTNSRHLAFADHRYNEFSSRLAIRPEPVVLVSRRPLMRAAGCDIRTKKGKVKRQVLADVVRRIVAAARPDKIILFGSAARGEMGPNSDLDLLVVKAGKFHRRRLTRAIYCHLEGIDASVDVVVATPEEVERYRDTPCLVIYPALREGKVVYGA